MPYLIDGHNLIPQLGLSLDLADDELRLVNLLMEFCRLNRKQVEVFFDGAQPGQLRTKKFGAVTAHFVRTPATADDAIAARLRRLGKSARNWILVSSDRRVQSEAKACGAQVLSSPKFADLLRDQIRRAEKEADPSSEKLNEDEIRDWLELFGGKKQ